MTPEQFRARAAAALAELRELHDAAEDWVYWTEADACLLQSISGRSSILADVPFLPGRAVVWREAGRCAA